MTRPQKLQVLSDTVNTAMELETKYRNYNIIIDDNDINELLIMLNKIRTMYYKAEVQNVR